MLAHTISTLSLAAIYFVAAPLYQLGGTHAALPKRCGGCGRWGGYSGYGEIGRYGRYGLSFVASFTNDFDRSLNHANYNKNMFYVNNVNANAASDNVNIQHD
ncbi:hypothetical protein GGI17_002107 [Coemansia sp. S146]|nr:hypothetical protein GGI17_002107 [Coemansia sp. S146]